jgi:hypothetical protein
MMRVFTLGETEHLGDVLQRRGGLALVVADRSRDERKEPVTAHGRDRLRLPLLFSKTFALVSFFTDF